MVAVVSLPLVLLLMAQAASKSIPSFATAFCCDNQGPYITYMEYIQRCERGGKGLDLNLRTSQYNPFKPYDKQLVTGNLTLAFPISDNMMLFSRSDIFRNNQWKENAMHFKFPRACSAFRDNAPDFFVLANGGRPAPKTGACEIRAGFYNLNHRLEWRFPNFPILPYGRYRLRSTLSLPEKPDAMCFVLVANIVPRP